MTQILHLLANVDFDWGALDAGHTGDDVSEDYVVKMLSIDDADAGACHKLLFADADNDCAVNGSADI